MPYKERTVPRQFPWSYRENVYPSNPPPPFTDVTDEFNTLEETINYGVGRSKYNSCSHYKRTLVPQVVSYTIQSNTNDSYHEYRSVPPLVYRFPMAADLDVISNGFVGRSYVAMVPDIESKVSIPNFLLELRELKTLHLSALKSLELIRQPTKAFAQLHLLYSFGIAPLMGDLGSMSMMLTSFLNEYNALIRGMNKVQVGHYQEESNLAGYSDTTTYSTVRYRITVPDCKLTTTATMKYRYRIPRHLLAKSPWEFFPKYMGFRKDSRIIWNAIPYSFAVDWVYKVGEWLAQFDEGVIPVDLEILDYCVSTRYSRESHLYVEDNPLNTSYDMVPGTAYNGSGRLVDYQRQPINPLVVRSSIVLPKTDGLSVRELLLASSLLNLRRGAGSR